MVKFLKGLWHRKFLVVIDNFFSSIGLFMNLLVQGMYVTGTLRSNRIGLLDNLKDTKSFKNAVQSTIYWRMYDGRCISCVLWKDKKPMLHISTHVVPIQSPCVATMAAILCQRRAIREYI